MASRRRMKGGEIKYTMSVDDLKKLITKRARCRTYGYITTYKCNDLEINAMDNDIKTTVENMITNYEYNDVENVIDLPQFQTISTLLKTISFKKETYENLIEQLNAYISKKTKYDKLYIEKTNEILHKSPQCNYSFNCVSAADTMYHPNVTVKEVNKHLTRYYISDLKGDIGKAVNAALVEPTFMPHVNDVNDTDTSVVGVDTVNNEHDNLTPPSNLSDSNLTDSNLPKLEEIYIGLPSNDQTTFQNKFGLIPAPAAAAGGSRRKHSKKRRGKHSKKRRRKQSKRRKHSKRRT